MRYRILVPLLGLAAPVYGGWMVPGPIHLGILSCSVGRQLDIPSMPDAAAASEAREMTCSFKPAKNGPEEGYSAVVRSVSAMGKLSERMTMLWAVRAPLGTEVRPGLLQQSYAADPAASAAQESPLTGEKNADISLQPMTDKEPGSASKEKPPMPRYVITAVELILRVATG